MVSHSSASTESASSDDTARPSNAEISDSDSQVEEDVSRWLQTTNPNIEKLYNLALNVTNHSHSNGHKILEALVSEVQILLSREQRAERTPPSKLEHALFLDGQPRRIRADACDIFLDNCDSVARFLLLACERDESLKANNYQVSVKEQTSLLERGFNQPYIGDTVRQFLEVVQYCHEEYDPKRHHGRVIPILQSSACGKSRLIKELAKQECLISVCFRDNLDPTSGWPPGDMAAKAFFDDHCDGDYKSEELAAAFLGAFAEVAAETMDFAATIALAKWGYVLPGSRQQDVRGQCMQMIAERANHKLESRKAWLKKERAWMAGVKSTAPRSTSSYSSTPWTKQNLAHSPTWHKKLVSEFCADGFQALNDNVLALGRSRFFFAIDECSALGEGSDPTEPPMNRISLIAMQQILKAVDSLSIKVEVWFLLLDTNSEPFLQGTSNTQTESHHMEKSLTLLCPFVYLGFNQMARHISVNIAREVLGTDHLRIYGRPYWSTLNAKDVMDMAREKLFYVRRGAPIFDSDNQQHVFAAFASRVALELTDNETARQLAVEAVSDHMRMIVSILGNKMKTEAPSEPVLALAAAVALTENMEGYREALAYLFDELILEGVILDRGAQGELCTRLLLILARDHAAMSVHHGRFMDASLTHILPITLADFLETLVGPDYGCPDEESKETVTELRTLSHGLAVHWTHFHVLKKPLNEIPIAMLEWAFYAGAALQCAQNQENIDLLLPTYSGSLDEPYSSDYLGAVGVKAKVQEGVQTTKVGEGLTIPPIVVEREGRRTRVKKQTIVILMDFGAESGIERKAQLTCRAATTPYDDQSLTETQRERIWRGYCDTASGDEPEPENFFLCIRGRGPETYSVMEGSEEEFRALFDHRLFTSLPVPYTEMEAKMEEIWIHSSFRLKRRRCKQLIL